MKATILSSIYFLVILTFQLQGRQLPVEFVDVHVAKNIAVAGETLWFKIQVTDGKSATNVAVAYAELVDRKGRTVKSAIFPLENGIAKANLVLPTSLESDHYLLRCYTRTSPFTHAGGVNNQFITVFNVTKPPILNAGADTVSLYRFNYEIDNEAILDQSIYRNASFPLRLNNEDISNTTSLAISMENPFIPTAYRGFVDGSIYKPLPSTIKIIPELYGHIVNASTFETEVDTTETFFLSAVGEQSYLISAKPTVSGDLFFELGTFRNYKYFIIQSEKFERQLNIKLNEPFLPLVFNNDFTFPPLNISEEDRTLIYNISLSGKITSYYYSDTTVYHKKLVLNLDPDITYDLDAYTRFDNLATTLKEYVSQVYVRGQGRKTQFKVVNSPIGQAFEDNPLITIDGMPVFDTDALGAFDAAKIKQLDLITRVYSFNKDKYSGLISLTSYNNDFGGFPLPPNALYLTYPEMQPMLSLISPHVNENREAKYNPDVRSLLYWQPERRELPTSFFSSDIPGKYVISIGHGKEGKRMKVVHLPLEVKSID